MKLFNKLYPNQSYTIGSGIVKSDAEGYIELEDKDMVEFFKKQGWVDAGKAEKAEKPAKAKPEKAAEPVAEKASEEVKSEDGTPPKKWTRSK